MYTTYTTYKFGTPRFSSDTIALISGSGDKHVLVTSLPACKILVFPYLLSITWSHLAHNTTCDVLVCFTSLWLLVFVTFQHIGR